MSLLPAGKNSAQILKITVKCQYQLPPLFVSYIISYGRLIDAGKRNANLYSNVDDEREAGSTPDQNKLRGHLDMGPLQAQCLNQRFGLSFLSGNQASSNCAPDQVVED